MADARLHDDVGAIDQSDEFQPVRGCVIATARLAQADGLAQRPFTERGCYGGPIPVGR